MSTTLDTLTLSDNIVITGLLAATRISATPRRTLGGRAVIDPWPVPLAGTQIALSGQHTFTFGQLVQIKEIEAAAQPVVLQHPRGNYRVYVIGIEADASFNPLADPAADEWYSATINMIIKEVL